MSFQDNVLKTFPRHNPFEELTDEVSPLLLLIGFILQLYAIGFCVSFTCFYGACGIFWRPLIRRMANVFFWPWHCVRFIVCCGKTRSNQIDTTEKITRAADKAGHEE